MAAIASATKGCNENGEYTEYTLRGKRRKVVVQKSESWWYVYDVMPGKDGLVKTIGNPHPFRTDAEMFAMGYVAGLK